MKKKSTLNIFTKDLVCFTFLFILINCDQIKILSHKTLPNVIIILADDQGWGATSVKMDLTIPESASDFVKTPNLERMASKGIVFSNGYAASPNCSPTRASLLTGKTPAQLKITDIINRHEGDFFEGNRLIPPAHLFGIPDKEITIAELIKSNFPEYKTAHFGKWHLGDNGPTKHGFDDSDGETANVEGNQNISNNPKDIFGITSRSISWINSQVKSETPFFIQISHYATHLAMESMIETKNRIKTYSDGKRHFEEDFAAMSEDLDSGIGMLLDQIEKLGIADNTYIIYMADNGTYPTKNISNINGPLHGWKASLWEGGIKVPFIISGPGIEQGYISEAVSTVDILPTISEWLSIKNLPRNIDGGSLASVLTKKTVKVDRENDFILFYFPHYQHQKGSHPSVAIINDNFKLIKYYEEDVTFLFNLNEDRLELKNLSSSNPKKVIELERLITEYFSKHNIKLPVVNEDYKFENDKGLKYVHIKERLMKEDYFIP